ncbi:heterokaryon incompatibility protein-domain-containing protein [Halenospora varia]|nr:heterokaryon incompatibility protein-domain-containing protein [Halenospora varia]
MDALKLRGQCPHAQFKAESNRFETYVSLSTCISSSSDCPECKLLLQVVENFKPDWIEDKKLDDGLIYITYLGGPVTIGLLGPFHDSFIISAYDHPKAHHRTTLCQSLDIIPDSGSDRAFDRATKWLSYCLSHNEKCCSPSSTYIPRRLLYLGSGGKSHDPILFEPMEPVPYVCLSYCWGSDVEGVLKTTTETLETHYHGIPLSSLPRTIYDAVIFCQGLKLQYLWVDSLCIVQDDRESWLVDSSQMSEIYSNALITLAIEEPASCKDGFLGKQLFGSEWQQRVVAHIGPEAGGPGKAVFIQPSTSQSSDGTQRCSLNQRGWCLQESILSKRRLCFDGNEMTWECAHRKICECGHASWVTRSMEFAQLGYSLRPPTSKLRQSKPFELCRTVVEEYSNRHLTEEGDKLVAVSALAKLILENFKNSDGNPHTYLAGLWKEEFLYDITWSVVSSEDHKYRRRLTPQYRSPTWSWASLDGPICWKFRESVLGWKYRPKLLTDCKIDDVVSVSVLTSDPTGPVSSAHARITGQLAHVSKDGFQQAEVFLDRPDEFALCAETEEDQGPHRRPVSWLPWNGKNQDKLESLDINASYTLLRLFTYIGFTGRPSGPKSKKPMVMGPEIWFLVLKTSPALNGAYKRVGVGKWTRNSGEWDSKEEYCPLFQGCETRSIKDRLARVGSLSINFMATLYCTAYRLNSEPPVFNRSTIQLFCKLLHFYLSLFESLNIHLFARLGYSSIRYEDLKPLVWIFRIRLSWRSERGGVQLTST